MLTKFSHLNIKINNQSELIEKLLSYKWRQRINLGNNFFTPGYVTENHWLRSLLPEDMSGKKFLDIGANDGMISFMAERKGAKEVVALDVYGFEKQGNRLSEGGISLVKEYLNSHIQIIDSSVYDLHKLKNSFDIVFLGDVFVWLDNPLLAMEEIAHVCSDTLIIRDSFWTGFNKEAALKYGANNPFIFTPNLKFISECLLKNGFKTVDIRKTDSMATVLEMAEMFPVVKVQEGVPVYSNPFTKNSAQKIEQSFTTIVTGVFENRVFLKLMGWVEMESVQIQHYTHHPLKKTAQRLLGKKYFNHMKNYYFEKSRDTASFVIIAKK